MTRENKVEWKKIDDDPSSFKLLTNFPVDIDKSNLRTELSSILGIEPRISIQRYGIRITIAELFDKEEVKREVKKRIIDLCGFQEDIQTLGNCSGSEEAAKEAERIADA